MIKHLKNLNLKTEDLEDGRDLAEELTGELVEEVKSEEEEETPVVKEDEEFSSS